MGLLAAMVGSAGLALIPGFRVLWVLNVVIDVCLVAYVTLLLRVRAAPPVRAVRPVALRAVDDSAHDLAFAYARAVND